MRKMARAVPAKTTTLVSLNPWRNCVTMVEKVTIQKESILKQFLNLFPLLI
jgi:hypothetical protein